MKKRTTPKNNFKFKKLNKDLHWLDAVSETGWVSKSDMDEQEPATAVCSQMWIYKETKKYITLFGTYSYDKKGNLEFGEVITIPKIWM